IVWQYVFVPLHEPPQSPATPEVQDKPAPETRVPPPTAARPSAPSTPSAGDSGEGQAAPPQSLNERLRVADFTPSVTHLTVTAQQPRGTVRFEYQDPTGWRVVKTFELQYDSYAMEVGVTLDKPGLKPVAMAATAPEPERLVTVENDLVRLVMTTRGARIKELLLKKYAGPWKAAPNLVWRWDYLWGSSGASTMAPVRGGNGALVNLVEASEAGLCPALEISADGQYPISRASACLH